MRISDWSSDVCSSDLVVAAGADRAEIETRAEIARTSGQDGDARVPVFRESREGFAKRECGEGIDRIALCGAVDRYDRDRAILRNNDAHRARRSEERRVGKECVSTCRSRWSPYQKKKKAPKHKSLTR